MLAGWSACNAMRPGWSVAPTRCQSYYCACQRLTYCMCHQMIADPMRKVSLSQRPERRNIYIGVAWGILCYTHAPILPPRTQTLRNFVSSLIPTFLPTLTLLNRTNDNDLFIHILRYLYNYLLQSHVLSIRTINLIHKKKKKKKKEAFSAATVF